MAQVFVNARLEPGRVLDVIVNQLFFELNNECVIDLGGYL